MKTQCIAEHLVARMGDPGVNLTPERLNRDFGRNGELKKLDQKLR